MLETPHIWAFHHRHDGEVIHPRSLMSKMTMADYDPGPRADPHVNGTIWAAMLWELRSDIGRAHPEGARTVDRLALAALAQLGRIGRDDPVQRGEPRKRTRSNFATAAAVLLQADAILYEAEHRARGGNRASFS